MFPLQDRNRRTIRAEVNPLDKSTVVSIYPKEVLSVNHTMFPGTFVINPGTLDKPTLLVVGTSSWFKEMEEDQPLLEITVGSIQVANSIIVDFCNGLYGCNMHDAMPGLFFVQGEVTEKDLKVRYVSRLQKANENQKRYFSALVRQADALWSRSNGNPLAISDDMRLAANELGVAKEWLADFQHIEMIRCVACGAMRNPNYPICGACHNVIDTEAYKKLGIMKAG
jgi:hypothetical protein